MKMPRKQRKLHFLILALLTLFSELLLLCELSSPPYFIQIILYSIQGRVCLFCWCVTRLLYTWLTSAMAGVIPVSLGELKSLLRQIALLAYWQIGNSSWSQDNTLTHQECDNLPSLNVVVSSPKVILVYKKLKSSAVRICDYLLSLFWFFLMKHFLFISLYLFLCISSPLIWLYRINSSERERETLDR